jgi:hypothetical protein
MRSPKEPAIDDPNRAPVSERPPSDGRKPWETPRIIESELSDAEHSGNIGFDGAGLLSHGS